MSQFCLAYVFRSGFLHFLPKLHILVTPVLEGLPETVGLMVTQSWLQDAEPTHEILFSSQSKVNSDFVSCVGEDVLALIFVHIFIIQT